MSSVKAILKCRLFPLLIAVLIFQSPILLAAKTYEITQTVEVFDNPNGTKLDTCFRDFS